MAKPTDSSLWRLPRVERHLIKPSTPTRAAWTLSLPKGSTIPPEGSRHPAYGLAAPPPRRPLELGDEIGSLGFSRTFFKQGQVQSGIFPCFFDGFLSRLVWSISSASISFLRVSRGGITASTYPRSAATYGLANRLRNSSIFSLRMCSRLAACCCWSAYFWAECSSSRL